MNPVKVCRGNKDWDSHQIARRIMTLNLEEEIGERLVLLSRSLLPLKGALIGTS